MSLQGITEKIQAEATAEATTIKSEAEKKRAEIVEAATSQKADIESAFKTTLEKQQAHRRSVVESLEKQRASMALQSVKRRVLDDVYEQALTELLATPASDYVSLLVSRYEALVPKKTKITSIVAPENRKKETEEIAKKLDWEAKITTDAKLKGGCVLVGSDFEYDLSLEKLFAESRAVTETDTANILFPATK